MGATVFIDSTPELYGKWLSEVVERQRALLARIERAKGDSPQSLVFINAWNEWGEGNHLEPDQRWGRAYLEATRRALGAATSETAEHANR
jgi:O-antigen biosynthesis protein